MTAGEISAMQPESRQRSHATQCGRDSVPPCLIFNFPAIFGVTCASDTFQEG